jgi:hypothetical protein
VSDRSNIEEIKLELEANMLQMDEMKEEKRWAAEEKRKNAKPWW